VSGKEKLEAQIAALDALRQRPTGEIVSPLRAALQQRNNYLVAKAADQVAQRCIDQLLPDLLAAFDRFFEDAPKRDPQCWAKNSLSRALAALELQEPEPFLRGLRHVQLEGSWGGSSDTAGPLRGTCALALVQCRTIPEPELLRLLLDLLADREKSARADAVRAIAQIGSPAASLVLRLRALMAGEEAEILGACYDIEGAKALPWINRFLAEEDDAAGEAALAMASAHTPEAFDLLKARWQSARDPWFGSVLLSAIALTRQTAATDFLLDLAKSDSHHAEPAVEAVLRALPSDEIVARLKSLVAGNSRLERIFAQNAPERRLCIG
jgi:hypothetical protein